MSSRKTDLLISIAYYGFIALSAYLLLRFLLPALLPFIAACLISASLQRPADILADRFPRLSRKAAAVSVLIIFYLFLGLSFSLIFRSLLIQLMDFLSTVPAALTEFAEQIIDSKDRWLHYFPAWFRDFIESADSGQYFLTAAEAIVSPLVDILGSAGSAAIRLPSFVFVIIITVIASLFITLDYDRVRSMLISVCPLKARKIIAHTKHRASQACIHLLRTYGILLLITFAELCVGFWVFNLLGAGIGYPVPLAMLICLIDVLPVLGVGTVLIPWALISLLSGSQKMCIMLLVLYGIMYIVRSSLESKLLGSKFGLPPVFTLLGIYVGGRWFGIIGILLFPLIMIVLLQLWKDGVFQKTPEGIKNAGKG